MSDQSTLPRTGFFTRDNAQASVALAGVSIDGEISSFCARVVVTQRYVNRETSAIEAVYIFPLDEGAAVSGFEVIVDDTLVVGEVKERDEAFDIYDEAMQAGHGAFLLDEERPDVFQASIGNLPPGKEVLVKLTYVTELTSAGGEGLRFAIPTTVSPRYAPAEDKTGIGRPDSEALNPDVAWQVPYGLNLSLRLAMPQRITRVESPSHPIAVAIEGDRATVTLSQRDAALDRDFVLSVEAAGLDAPQAWIERDEDGSAAVAVAFVPALGRAVTPGELIFVVDRSGSMGGTSIEEVRNALQLCLRSMVPGCYFNIVGFGSTFQALFPESRAYHERSLAEAGAHVAALNADLGGTEILPALKFVLEQQRREGLPRQVVVLTDGEVTNTDAVLALAAAHAADARVFTFGIGAGASHHLVEGLARAGGGSAEFVYPGERIEPKVVRQFARLLSPALTDVRVEWGGLRVTQSPGRVPAVFAGGRLIVYGLMERATPATARLAGTSPSGPFAFDVPIDPSAAATGRIVATLAARARIRELEESPAGIDSRGSRQKHRKERAVANEIVALSVKYGLLSRETSFVAVERRETPVHGDIQLRRIPIALTTGWGGLERVALGAVQLSAPSTRLSAAYLSRGGFDALADAAPSASAFMHRAAESFEFLARQARVVPQRPAATPPAMQVLVAMQRADGSWELNDEFARALGCYLRELEAALPGMQARHADARRAWATALAIAWLRRHARDFEDEWRMLAGKAERWLDTVAIAPATEQSWIEAAEDFVGQL